MKLIVIIFISLSFSLTNDEYLNTQVLFDTAEYLEAKEKANILQY